MTKASSFVAQFVALIKGDDVTAQAAKVWRQAESALKVQISGMEGNIELEDAIQEAQEALELARVNNGKPITDRASYTTNLINAKNKVTKAEKELELHKITLAFYKEELASLGTMVEVKYLKQGCDCNAQI